MKVVFILQRLNYYKYMGPLISEAINRNWQVECWLQDAKSGSKAYLNPSTDNIPQGLNGKMKTRVFSNKDNLNELVERNSPNVIFSLHSRHFHSLDGPIKAIFVTIQHGPDSFLEATPEELCDSDILCLQTHHWMEWAANYYAKAGFGEKAKIRRMLQRKAIFCGTPLLDVLDNLDPGSIRKEFKIPTGKKVVLLLPINLAFGHGPWAWLFSAKNRWKQFQRLVKAINSEGFGFLRSYWQWPLFGWNDTSATNAIRKFCDRNNAFLIVKGRQKDAIRETAESLADLTIYDEEYFPATIYKLMRIADLCIHFYSSATMEAAFFGAYGLCVDRPNIDSLAYRLWMETKEGSAFNFPGVNSLMTIPNLIRNFPKCSFANFRMYPDARNRFINQYVGNSDTINSSSRIMDHFQNHSDRVGLR